MKKSFKVLGLVLILSMVFLFSACGANNDAKSTDTQAVQTTAGTQAATTTAKNTEPIKMKLLIMSADESRKAIADKFEAGIPKDMPEYSVEIERAGGGEDYNNKLKTYNAVGELPDIFWVDNIPNTVPLINSGMLLDLTSSVTSDGFLDKYSPKPQAWNDGKYYVLNVGSDEYFVPRIFYRKSIFEQNKVAVPKTLDEFMAACKVFKDKGLVPWATYAKDGWCFTTYLFQNLVMSEDPQVMKDLMANKTDFSNKVCINAINRIQQMVNSGVFQQGVLTGEYGAVSDLFTQKKAAMYTMFTWIIPTLATDDDVDFFAFPQINTSIDRDKLIQIWGGPLNGYACSSKTKDPAATVKMLEYMIQTEGLYWNADQKTPTTYNSGVKLENLPALMQKHVDNYASAEKMVTFSNYVFSAKMNTEFNTLGQKVLSGKYSGEDFAKDINPVWANSLKELTQ